MQKECTGLFFWTFMPGPVSQDPAGRSRESCLPLYLAIHLLRLICFSDWGVVFEKNQRRWKKNWGQGKVNHFFSQLGKKAGWAVDAGAGHSL